MSPEEAREAMLDAAMSSVDKKNRPQWAYEFDYLTRRGFSISLASVRDHTNCETCGGSGERLVPRSVQITSNAPELNRTLREPTMSPCPGGSPVVWSTE